jgi:GNAT superfamily N-acetyltransferase
VTARLRNASTISRIPTSVAGRRLQFRLLEDGEREPLVQVFNGLSAHSRYLRFLYPVPRLTEPMLRALTNVDGHGRVALGVFDGSACVAIARFNQSRECPHTADLAMAVVDSLQRRGIGRLALTVLAGVAADRGVSTFVVTVHPDNHGSLSLLRSFSAQLRLIDRTHEGHVAVSAILEHARVPAPAREWRRERTTRIVPRVRYSLP